MRRAAEWLRYRRKAAAVVLGSAAELIVTLGLDNRYPWLAVVVAAATAAGVYGVRNGPTPAAVLVERAHRQVGQ